MLKTEPTQISKSALLPYRAEQLFSLVNDIESYPTFLDGCYNAEIISKTESVLEAKLYLRKHGFEQNFTTCNHLYPNERVTMELVQGPFESLEGEWNITELADQGCKLSLDLAFSLGRSPLMQLAAPFFTSMGNRLVDAVVEEASKRFDKNQEKAAS